MTSTTKSSAGGISSSPVKLIVILGISIRLTHFLILYILSLIIPPFDSSHTLVSSNIVSPGLRWDSIHFLSIAQRGYQYEQQLAFQPFLMGLWRIIAESINWLRGKEVGVNGLVLIGMGVSALAWVGSCVMLYKITNHLYNPKFALTTTILYMIPPTPVPSLPYTEPLYALTTFTGIWFLVVKRQYLLSGICFACSTGIRATGVFNVLILGGIVVLGDMKVGDMSGRVVLNRLVTRSWKAIIPCLLTISPFLLFQWYAYQSFCGKEAISNRILRPWCSSKLPFVYGFVQKEYWNIGLFNYWTISNIPNFSLPLPIFMISFLGTFKYSKNLLRTSQTRKKISNQFCDRPELMILYLHHILMMSLILFGSHTQILLRTCITDPVIWCNIAGLAVDWQEPSKLHKIAQKENTNSDNQIDGEKRILKLTKIGKWWIGWCIIWSTISTILWVGHYPPA